MTSRRFTLEDLQRKGFQISGNQASKLDSEKPKANRKIIGAEKQEIDGIKFASKLEAYLYNLLKVTKIPFLFQVEYELQPKFVFQGTNIRVVKIIPDFYLPDHDMIIDSKGWSTDKNKLQIKLLKYKLVSEGKNTAIELPSTKDECEALIFKLINKKP